jgi:cholesterol oxidase
MEQFDAVIIGSGYGGSIMAARLAEVGMSVLVLERGARWSTSDFKQSDDPRYVTEVVDLVVGSSNVAFRTGRLVGGASIPMDGAHFRMPQKSFGVTDTGGRPYWPSEYSRAVLDPYYARVEAMLKVRQFAWTEISRSGGLFAKMLDGAGASCDRARLNYTDCVHCGFCSAGCIFDKKMSMLLTYIPLAESKGAVVRPGCLVDHLAPDGTGYIVSYANAGAPAQVRGARVFVAGGGIHSPALLLRSAPYLPNLSSQVGENFNNNGEYGVIGILPPEFDDLSRYACFKGSENAAMMSYSFFESDGITMHPGGGMEPSILASAIAAANDPVLPSRSWGMEYKRFVEAIYPHRLIAFSTLGLADGHRAIVLRSDGTPDIAERNRTSYDAYLDRVEAILTTISQKTGVRLVPTVPRRLTGMTSAHLLSACRMADTAQNGVVDSSCQVFGHENLYVCDASAMPYALGVNPALTISAVTEWTAEKVIAKG